MDDLQNELHKDLKAGNKSAEIATREFNEAMGQGEPAQDADRKTHQFSIESMFDGRLEKIQESGLTETELQAIMSCATRPVALNFISEATLTHLKAVGMECLAFIQSRRDAGMSDEDILKAIMEHPSNDIAIGIHDSRLQRIYRDVREKEIHNSIDRDTINIFQQITQTEKDLKNSLQIAINIADMERVNEIEECFFKMEPGFALFQIAMKIPYIHADQRAEAKKNMAQLEDTAKILFMSAKLKINGGKV